jgi:S-formylglutathione hydrolase FrmB
MLTLTSEGKMAQLALHQLPVRGFSPGTWLLPLLVLWACGDPQQSTVPAFAGTTTEQQPLPNASDSATTQGTGSGGELSGAATSESDEGEMTEGATSEGVDEGITLAPGEPEDAVAGEPEDAVAGEPEDAVPMQPELAVPSIGEPGYPMGAVPRLVPMQFVGPISGQPVLFNVYLPPGYDSGTASYPVLYDLHGLTDSRDTNPGPVIRSFEAGMRNRVIGPLIVVFPQSFAEAYYANSRDGARPGETQMIGELVPYVDQNFRTLAHRARRGVSGFSMGGFGALAYATKYPYRFSVGIGYDSALDTWETLVGRRAYIATAAFGNDEPYFDQISPWANATLNAAALTESSTLRVVPGDQYRDFNAVFRDHLTALGIPHGFAQTDCPHAYDCLIDREGANSWAVIQAAFAQPATETVP